MAPQALDLPKTFDQDRLTLRQEEVATEAGTLWVREMMTSDTVLIEQYAMRPPEDPRGGYDRQELAIWQVALSCFSGPEENARRVWPDQDVWKIGRLPERIYIEIVKAINRVNGKSATEEEALRDFTQAAEAPRTSG